MPYHKQQCSTERSKIRTLAMQNNHETPHHTVFILFNYVNEKKHTKIYLQPSKVHLDTKANHCFEVSYPKDT